MFAKCSRDGLPNDGLNALKRQNILVHRLSGLVFMTILLISNSIIIIVTNANQPPGTNAEAVYQSSGSKSIINNKNEENDNNNVRSQAKIPSPYSQSRLDDQSDHHHQDKRDTQKESHRHHQHLDENDLSFELTRDATKEGTPAANHIHQAGIPSKASPDREAAAAVPDSESNMKGDAEMMPERKLENMKANEKETSDNDNFLSTEAHSHLESSLNSVTDIEGDQKPKSIRRDDKRLFILELLHHMIVEADKKNNTKVIKNALDLMEHLEKAQLIPPAPPTPMTTRSTGKPFDLSIPLSQINHFKPSGGSRLTNFLEHFDFVNLGQDQRLRSLYDWIRGLLIDAPLLTDAINEVAIQRLASINCLGLGLTPDSERDVMPKFYIYKRLASGIETNKPQIITHAIEENDSDGGNNDDDEDNRVTQLRCPSSEYFEPESETVVITHGFLSGFLVSDGVNNIKDRLIDLNKQNGGAEQKLSQYNIVVVDWFKAANPAIKANYIRGAVNSQVVGKLIGKFLLRLKRHCKLELSRVHLLSHSLGTHAASAAGKYIKIREKGRAKIGKMTHLDPIGLCFGKLLSKPEYLMSPDDATETVAIQVGINLFDNPLDGVQSNFMLNGGKNQLGCASEYANSSIASVGLLFDDASSYKPCSHMRVLAIFEDDHSSQPDECQMVGYECRDYTRFLAGRCSTCDRYNSQCKLMGFDVISKRLERMSVGKNSTIEDHDYMRSSVNSHHHIYEYGLSKPRTPGKQQRGRLFFLGTSAISNYCVNYYSLRIIFKVNDLKRLETLPRLAQSPLEWNWSRPSNSKLNAYFAIKLNDDSGRFFKGFSVHLERKDLEEVKLGDGKTYMEFAFLLNTTNPKPIKIAEAIVSVRSGQNIRPKQIQLHYMSNIDFR